MYYWVRYIQEAMLNALHFPVKLGGGRERWTAWEWRRDREEGPKRERGSAARVKEKRRWKEEKKEPGDTFYFYEKMPTAFQPSQVLSLIRHQPLWEGQMGGRNGGSNSGAWVSDRPRSHRAAAWSHTRLSLEPLTTGHDRVGFLSHLTICCNLAL